MLNTLKKLSINIKDNIMLYDYKKLSYTNNINNLLNNDYDYDYVISIDYDNNQLDIDLYKKNSHNILYNININLYYNNDAFNLFIDAILNKDHNYSIIKINKYALRC